MNTDRNFNDWLWHDGLLTGFEFVLSDNVFRIDVFLYSSNEQPTRSGYSVVFQDVMTFSVNADVGLIKDNAQAGNINDAYCRGGRVYRFFVIDGYIEVTAKSCNIVESCDVEV